jgi:hypothetical protein
MKSVTIIFEGGDMDFTKGSVFKGLREVFKKKREKP